AAQVRTVTNTGDKSGGVTVSGSLRDAIEKANVSLAPADAILFNIPTSDPGYDPDTQTWRIQPTSALPALTSQTFLDATTQPGYAGSPVIELDGESAGAGVNGLAFVSGAGGSALRGLAINRFQSNGGGGGNGLVLSGSLNDLLIEDNYIGTDVTGAS